jgi:glycosyltransferase involved in cell wall biosynthesis
MDIGIIPSVLYESFGVAAVEAEASGIPVIVTDVGGLIEVTVPGESSIVVPRQNEEAIAKAIIELWSDTEKKDRWVLQGESLLKMHYELNNCFNNIESIFLKRVNQQN